MLIHMVEVPDLIPMPAAIAQLKPVATGNAVRWAIQKQVVNPLKIGPYTLFTHEQVEALKKHFQEERK